MQKLLIPGDKDHANNQRTAVDYMADTISARRIPPGQDAVVKYATSKTGKPDKRCLNIEGTFLVMVCVQTETVPTNWPAVDGEYNRQFLKLLCAGIKIVRQLNNGRIAIYTVDKSTWLQVIQKSITHGVNSLEWDQVRKLCKLPPVVSHPFPQDSRQRETKKTACA